MQDITAIIQEESVDKAQREVMCGLGVQAVEIQNSGLKGSYGVGGYLCAAGLRFVKDPDC